MSHASLIIEIVTSVLMSRNCGQTYQCLQLAAELCSC